MIIDIPQFKITLKKPKYEIFEQTSISSLYSTVFSANNNRKLVQLCRREEQIQMKSVLTNR